MTGQVVGPPMLIPSEFSGRAKVVGCPWCKTSLMLVVDESGRATTPLEVHGWDLAASTAPGVWNTRGGWIHAAAHRCATPVRGE